MPDRWQRGLRAVTWGLAALLGAQLLVSIFRKNPLSGLQIPRAPHWQAAETNGPAPGPGGMPPMPPTAIRPSSAPSTNAVAGTNPAPGSLSSSGTNAASGTNVVSRTNALPSTNLAAGSVKTGPTNALASTNLVAGTNQIGKAGSTNLVASTNAPASKPPMALVGPPFPGGMNPGGPGMRRPRPSPPLPPLTQARIEKVTQSEIFVPIMRPPPMALLGIAGRDAFIRTPSGQTTLLREGGESDGIKLLRLGTNRVLIEQAGEKKELTIFDGFGSESLLPK